MKKILITGKTGFIGSYLFDKIKNNYEVFDLGCDLRDQYSINNRVQEVNPNIVIHLAARTEVEKSFYEQSKFNEINYVGTVNLLEACKNLKNLELFLFSSTMETYGWQPESDLIKEGKPFQLPVFDENTPQNPNAPYAVAKLACEQYIKYLHRVSGIPYCILRQTNSYGRRDNDFFVVERIISQMLTNPDEINLGYRTPYRNFLFIDDLIDLYLKIIENIPKSKNQIFCTGPNNALTIEDLTNKIASIIGWNGKVNWNTRPERIGEIYVLNSTNKKVTDLLGWSPKVNLDEGLQKTVEIWRIQTRKIP